MNIPGSQLESNGFSIQKDERKSKKKAYKEYQIFKVVLSHMLYIA